MEEHGLAGDHLADRVCGSEFLALRRLGDASAPDLAGCPTSSERLGSSSRRVTSLVTEQAGQVLGGGRSSMPAKKHLVRCPDSTASASVP